MDKSLPILPVLQTDTAHFLAVVSIMLDRFFNGQKHEPYVHTVLRLLAKRGIATMLESRHDSTRRFLSARRDYWRNSDASKPYELRRYNVGGRLSLNLLARTI